MAAPQRILLVEDDADQRALYMLVLSRAGFEVTPAADGEQALTHLNAQSFDLVLSDLYLPGITGGALIHSVRERYRLTKTILMSNHYSVEEEADACDADGCLRKGDIHRMVTLVATTLGTM